MDRRRIVEQAAGHLARARSEADIAQAAVAALRRLIHPRDDFVLARLEPDLGAYRVLGASAPGKHTEAGRMVDHPVLSSLDRIDRQATLDRRDRRYSAELLRMMEVGQLHRLVYLPVLDPFDEVRACVVVLTRRRWGRLGRHTGNLLKAVGAATRVVAINEASERTRAEHEEVAAALHTLVDSTRAFDTASTVEDVVGEVLGRVQVLDERLIGAVVGVVTDRIVTRVAAVGATPRSAIEATRGTRLDGFPIGRQLIAERKAIFANIDEVSHATRSKIMDPLGARSLLAAAGRSGGDVRIVLSVYRPQADPPTPWTMAAIESVLDNAAATVAGVEKRAWLTCVADMIESPLVILNTKERVLHCNAKAKELLPSCTGAQGFPMNEYETLEGTQPSGAENPFDTSSGEEREATLRFRPTGAIHAIRVSRLQTGERVVLLSELPPRAEAGEPDQVLDLTERRKRRSQ